MTTLRVTPSRAGAAVVAGPPASFTVVEDLGALAALEPAWRALATPRRFFTGPEWTLAWLRWRGGDGVSPHGIVARDAAGVVVGMLPLARTRRGDLVVCGAGDGAAHVDVLAADGREDAVAAGVLDRLAAHGEGRVRLHRLAEEGALARAVRARGEATPHLARPSTTCPYVVLASGWDAFLASLPKHHRHEMRRQTRRFFERDGARMRFAAGAAEVGPALDTLFDLHARRFDALRRRTDFAQPGRRAFHGALAAALEARGDLLLATLEEGGRAVAAAYGFHAGEVTYLFQTGIDPAFHATGAGVVIRSLVLEEAVANAGRGELDLLDGCYDWKARWANGVRVLVDVDVFPRTALGRGGHLVERALRAARRRAAVIVKGRRCPGRAGDEPVDPQHCRRVGCPFAA